MKKLIFFNKIDVDFPPNLSIELKTKRKIYYFFPKKKK
jgi:hypothetical protein